MWVKFFHQLVYLFRLSTLSIVVCPKPIEHTITGKNSPQMGAGGICVQGVSIAIAKIVNPTVCLNV